MKINVNALHSRYKRPTTTIDALEKQYPQLSIGIGKLKNFEVNLHVNETVRPLVQPHRRVPFYLQKQVEDVLQLLLAQYIIERAGGDEPTPWTSPVVTPLKPKDPTKVRICVDMRKANTAILRTRHVMPTVEDVITDLNGAKAMSKLDLSQAYHQLILSEGSRPITTFSANRHLFRSRDYFCISVLLLLHRKYSRTH